MFNCRQGCVDFFATRMSRSTSTPVAEKIVYAVAASPEEAQRLLLHSGSNAYVMFGKENAENAARIQSKTRGQEYKAFKARVTVELLED